MDDTISRQDAIDVARKCRVIEVTPAHMLIDKAEVMTELMMLPSASDWNEMIVVCDCCGHTIHVKRQRGEGNEAVPVVRCKDCKWFNNLGCAICVIDESDKPKETDFCSFGERKERDGNETN